MTSREDQAKAAFGSMAERVEREWMTDEMNRPPEWWAPRGPWEWAYNEMRTGRMLIGRTFIHWQDDNGPNFGPYPPQPTGEPD